MEGGPPTQAQAQMQPSPRISLCFCLSHLGDQLLRDQAPPVRLPHPPGPLLLPGPAGAVQGAGVVVRGAPDLYAHNDERHREDEAADDGDVGPDQGGAVGPVQAAAGAVIGGVVRGVVRVCSRRGGGDAGEGGGGLGGQPEQLRSGLQRRGESLHGVQPRHRWAQGTGTAFGVGVGVGVGVGAGVGVGGDVEYCGWLDISLAGRFGVRIPILHARSIWNFLLV